MVVQGYKINHGIGGTLDWPVGVFKALSRHGHNGLDAVTPVSAVGDQWT